MDNQRIEIESLRARVAELKEENANWKREYDLKVKAAQDEVIRAEKLEAERDELRARISELEAERDSLREETSGLRHEFKMLQFGAHKDHERVKELEGALERAREALTELARFDIDPKYLANGHDEVARLARRALSTPPAPSKREEAVKRVIEAARDWRDDTEEECNHHPEWQALSGALNALDAAEQGEG